MSPSEAIGYENIDRPSEQLRAGVGEHALDLRVEQRDFALVIYHQDAIRRRFKENLELLAEIALSQLGAITLQRALLDQFAGNRVIERPVKQGEIAAGLKPAAAGYTLDKAAKDWLASLENSDVEARTVRKNLDVMKPASCAAE